MGRYLVYITMSFFLSATAQVKHRPFVKTYKNGTKYITCFYLGNLLDSTYTEWSPSGEKMQEGIYKSGARQGRWTSWDLSTPNYDFTETYYLKGKKDSTYFFRAWPQDSTLKMSEIFTTYRDTIFTKELVWHTNGQLAEIEHFKNQRPDGPNRAWNAQGVLVYESFSRMGKDHGLTKHWSEQGLIRKEEYHEHGRLIWRKDYENGILTRERRYDKSGKVLEDKQHKDN